MVFFGVGLFVFFSRVQVLKNTNRLRNWVPQASLWKEPIFRLWSNPKGHNDKWQNWNWWGKPEQEAQKDKTGNSRQCRYQRAASLCMEAGLRESGVKSDSFPTIFVLPLDGSTKRCWQLPAGSLFQQPELSSAVVELARARWHTGYIGDSPPRTSFHIQQGLGWRKLSLCRELSVSLKKQSNRCFQRRQHQCFVF